jgi:hypothetical protein
MKVAVVLMLCLLLEACIAVESDDNYIHHQNEALYQVYLRTMRLSDYKVPEIDSPGRNLRLIYSTNQIKMKTL